METLELTLENYCDQKPVTMEFTFQEHDLLNDVLNHAIEVYDFAAFYEVGELPEDSQIRIRYEMLTKLKNHSFQLWKDRFGNAPYDNN